jgi:L-lactate permease
MDIGTQAGLISLISFCTTFIVEIVKAWLPARWKVNPKGLTFKRGRKKYLVPNQAVYPTLSAIIATGLFFAIAYNPLGSIVGDNLADALSGLAATGGAAGFFRAKNVLGSKAGGTEETSAQVVGPTSEQGVSPENEV